MQKSTQFFIYFLLLWNFNLNWDVLKNVAKPVVEVYEDTWSNFQIVTYEQTGMEKLLVHT
jgi:hypothetical protein